MEGLSDREFVEAAAAMGVSLTLSQQQQLWAYERLLNRWSERVRLVSRGDRSRLRQRHLLDSLSGATCLIARPGRLLDLGSGAGLPGVVLHIARPRAETVLLESARMKALFLRQVRAELGLCGLHVVHGRAESKEVLDLHGGRYDWVSVRGVGSLSRIWHLSRPLLRPGGRMLAYKGPGEKEEFCAEENDVRVEEVPVVIPDMGRSRSLVVVRAKNG